MVDLLVFLACFISAANHEKQNFFEAIGLTFGLVWALIHGLPEVFHLPTKAL
jgi:hypothetical protein